MLKETLGVLCCHRIQRPPHRLDQGPIEETFSKIKRLLRAIEARTKEALVEAIGKVLSIVVVQDTKGLFVHCGYPRMEHQLRKTL
jgi:transposase